MLLLRCDERRDNPLIERGQVLDALSVAVKRLRTIRVFDNAVEFGASTKGTSVFSHF
jgi:hypothetical protein